MKKIFYLAIMLLGAIVIFNSCEEDEYDWSSYSPTIQAITGMSEIKSLPTYTAEYVIDGRRKGSVYTWEVIQGSNLISVAASTEEDKWNVGVLTVLESTPTNAECIFTVFETTVEGGKGVKDTVTVTLTPYCPIDLSTFDGAYIELADDGSSPENADVTIAQQASDPYFGLVITNFAFSSYWWGEYTGATAEIKLDYCDNSVDFPEQEIGNLPDLFGYGPCTMLLADPAVKGVFDETTFHIEFVAEVTVAAGSFGAVAYEYDPAPAP